MQRIINHEDGSLFLSFAMIQTQSIPWLASFSYNIYQLSFYSQPLAPPSLMPIREGHLYRLYVILVARSEEEEWLLIYLLKTLPIKAVTLPIGPLNTTSERRGGNSKLDGD